VLRFSDGCDVEVQVGDVAEPVLRTGLATGERRAARRVLLTPFSVASRTGFEPYAGVVTHFWTAEVPGDHVTIIADLLGLGGQARRFIDRPGASDVGDGNSPGRRTHRRSLGEVAAAVIPGRAGITRFRPAQRGRPAEPSPSEREPPVCGWLLGLDGRDFPATSGPTDGSGGQEAAVIGVRVPRGPIYRVRRRPRRRCAGSR
jgi:hypothetical protein